MSRIGKISMTLIVIIIVIVAAIIGGGAYYYTVTKPTPTTPVTTPTAPVTTPTTPVTTPKPTPKPTPHIIKIGYTAPFTGTAAEFGTNGWRGISIALEEINAKGVMINGTKYTIQIIRYDDRCEPTEGVANLRRLVLDDHVVAFLGSHCSSVCMAIAPLADEYKVPGITIECAADGVTKPGHPFYFRMRPSMGLMAPLIAPVIVGKLNPKTVAFLAINDDYGRSFADSFKKEYAKSDVSTVYEGYFERGTTDFTAYLTDIKSKNPDIVMYIGVTPEGAMILKQAREMGLIPKIKFIGSEEMGEYELVKLGGASAVNETYSVSLWVPNPQVQALAKKVKEKYNAPMHYAIVFGYDALYTLVNAIEKSQSLDPIKIQQALKQTDYNGLEGHIKFEDFDGYMNQGRWVPHLIEWVNGEKVVVA